MWPFPKPEREYIFSFHEKEFPVYGQDKTRIGNCKKINVCDVEKREIRSYRNPSRKPGVIEKFLEKNLTNGLFLHLNPSEECIALNPWCISRNSEKSAKRYYMIPHGNYASSREFELLGCGDSKPYEAIVLKFSVKNASELEKYHSFEIRGNRDNMLW